MVETVSLELDRDRRENLANLAFTTFGADGDGIVVKRLHKGKIVSAVFAAVMISGHLTTPFTTILFGILIRSMTQREVILIPDALGTVTSLS